jgi:integrase
VAEPGFPPLGTGVRDRKRVLRARWPFRTPSRSQGQIDLSGRVVVFESLKKRRKGVFRAMPVPPELLDTLDMVHGLREAQRRGQVQALLWPWSRMTGFRRVQEVIAAAGIPAGPHACPKGLRHGFGVQAVSRGIALNMVQKWLGHAQLTTTAIYANAVGEEEQSIAARMW